MGKKIEVKNEEMEVEAEYKLSEIEAVINKYYESKGNKTPILVELSDLKNYIKENI